MIKPEEMTALLAEDPDFPAAWDAFGAVKASFQSSMTVDGLRPMLIKRAEIIKRDAPMKAQSDATAAAFKNANPKASASPSGNASSLDGILGQVVGGLGLTAGVATANLSHPNPQVYNCSPEILEWALDKLEDGDTRIKRESHDSTTTLVVEELIDTEDGSQWTEAIRVDFVQLEENKTQVTMGSLQVKAATDKVSKLAQSALGIGQQLMNAKRRGIFDSLAGIAQTITDTSNALTGKLADQLGGLTLKIQIWGYPGYRGQAPRGSIQGQTECCTTCPK